MKEHLEEQQWQGLLFRRLINLTLGFRIGEDCSSKQAASNLESKLASSSASSNGEKKQRMSHCGQQEET